jgi:hypothetical protein
VFVSQRFATSGIRVKVTTGSSLLLPAADCFSKIHCVELYLSIVISVEGYICVGTSVLISV